MTAALRAGLSCRTGDGEAGYVAMYVVAVTLGLLAMLGLVIDGGSAIAAREQAADVAQQAARAGADALVPASLRDADPAGLTASPAAAAAAAQQVLASAHVSGTVAVSGDTVQVRATVHQKTAILSVVGLADITGTATATATGVRGTTTTGSGS